MVELSRQDIATVWNNGGVPVIDATWIRTKELRVRLPFRRDNATWVRGERQRKPTWESRSRCWHCPRAWLEKLTKQSCERFGEVFILQLVKETERCAPACLEASGVTCECSCEGKNHGAGNVHRWFVVSETLALCSGDQYISGRLVRAQAR